MDKMIYQHKELAGGRWAKMSLAEQMANIGSEVSRALNWKKKRRKELSKKALYRALELIDLTASGIKQYSQLREIFRVREALVDFFCGTNEFFSSEESWRKYFDHFNYLARRNHF